MQKTQIRCCIHSVVCFTRKRLAVGLSMLAMGLLYHTASAQTSLFSQGIVGVSNNGGGLVNLDINTVFDNSLVDVIASQSFSGLDGSGHQRALSFSGQTTAQSNYGKLQCYTTGSLTNSYYNASNPAYADANGNIINPAGSPDSLASLGFAAFTDTFQFGGALQSGYKAKYIFHLTGTNSGTGALADLVVRVGSNPSEVFFTNGNGTYSQDWITQDYDINGVTPQSIYVQFSDQVVFDTFNLTDGQDYTGTSDFYSALTLAGIEVVDANGNPVSGWTATAESGTAYNYIGAQTTPEPSSMLMVFAGGLPLALWGRKIRCRRQKPTHN